MSGGGAIFASTSWEDIGIVDCVFDGNSCLEGTGGAIYVCTSNLILEECVLLDNTAQDGGAVFDDCAGSVIRSCELADNRAARDGGAVAFMGMGYAGSGGGGRAYLDRDFRRITNCTMRNNSAGSGGAIATVYYSASQVDSCTIIGNSAQRGGGIWNDHLSDTDIWCSIVVGNDGGGVWTEPGGVSDVFMACNDVWNNTGGDYIGCQPGEGDFSEDPMFCDPLNLDFHLHTHSPCVDGYGCGRVGAWDIGCGPTANVPATWGRVKSLYR